MPVSSKRLAASIGALLLLLVVALPFIAVLLRDPIVNSDPVRKEIDSLMFELTGRQFALSGDIDIDEFPWITILIGPGELENPPGFVGPPLLAWREIRLRVHYSSIFEEIPLLEPVIVSGLTVSLRRDAQGRDNWSGLGPLVDSGPPTAPLVIPGAELRDLVLRFVDESIVDEPLVELGGARLTIKDIRRGAGRIEGSRWRVASIELEGRAQARVPATEGTRIELADTIVAGLTGLDARFPEDAAPAVSATAASAEFGALQAKVRELRWTPESLATRLELRPAALDALLQAVGIEPPFKSTPRLLQLRQLQARLQIAAGTPRLTDLEARVDDTRIRGDASFGDPLQLALDIDALDLDRYASVLGDDDVDPEAPLAFPGRMLQALPLAGRIQVGELRSSGAVLTGVTLRLDSRPRTEGRTADKPPGSPTAGRPPR